MKFVVRFFLSAILSLLSAVSLLRANDDGRVYELRTYTLAPGKLDSVLARFGEHTTHLFEKHGMVNIGYFVPLDAADGAGEKLVYILSHASRDAATSSWKAFRADPEWLALSKASDANGKTVVKIESVFLSVANFSPAISEGARGGSHVYELRTYTTPEGKVDAIDARFRDHTHALFKEHGLVDVAYWHPLEGEPAAGHTLIYLLAHPDRDAAKANWAAFRADPGWIEAKAESEKKAGGPLTTETKSLFLAPTDFSALK